MKEEKKKPKVYYLNVDANGVTYVSKRPMNQAYYATMAKLKCMPTSAKRKTEKGVFVGAICVTIKDEILKIIEVENINGFKRDWIKEGKLETRQNNRTNTEKP